MIVRELCENDLKNLHVEIGNTFKIIREQKKLTISQVAKKVQKPERLVSNIENGKYISLKRIIWFLYAYDKKMKITFY